MPSAKLPSVPGPSSLASPKPSIARFGVFEADLEARELRKQGRRIRLQEQPFAILAMLVERAGSVVTREELRERLWPADTFVDFDHSLNTAVNKIREVLGDSATSPRFVETVARRGYRFLGQVQWETKDKTGPGTGIADDSLPSVTKYSDLEIPALHRGIPRALFGLIQVMYLIFYLEALIQEVRARLQCPELRRELQHPLLHSATRRLRSEWLKSSALRFLALR